MRSSHHQCPAAATKQQAAVAPSAACTTLEVTPITAVLGSIGRARPSELVRLFERVWHARGSVYLSKTLTHDNLISDTAGFVHVACRYKSKSNGDTIHSKAGRMNSCSMASVRTAGRPFCGAKVSRVRSAAGVACPAHFSRRTAIAAPILGLAASTLPMAPASALVSRDGTA